MHPVVMFILMNIGAIMLVGGILLLGFGFNPATRHKMKPILGTALIIVGDTMLLQFGDPSLLNMLIEWGKGLVTG